MTLKPFSGTKYLFSFFLVFVFQGVFSQVSDALYNRSLTRHRPKNRHALTMHEKRQFVKYAQDYIWQNDTSAIQQEIDNLADEIERDALSSNNIADRVLDYDALGDYYQYYKDRETARGLWVPYYEKVVSLGANDARFTKEVAYAHRGIAIYQVQRSRYEDASKQLNAALHLFNAISDTIGISSIHAFYSSLYLSLQLFDKALDAQRTATKYFTASEKSAGLAAFYTHENYLERALTFLCWYEREKQQNLLDSADWYIQHTAHFNGRREEQGLGTHHFVVGHRAFLTNDLKKALQYFDSSLHVLEYYPELNPTKLVYKGLCLLKLGRSQEAKTILTHLDLPATEHYLKEMAYQALYHLAMNQNQFKQAVVYQEIANAYNDSSALIVQRGKVFEVMQKYATMEKDIEIKNLAIANNEKEKQRNHVIWIFAFTTVGMGMTIILLFNISRARKIKALKSEVLLEREKRVREELIMLQERDLERARTRVIFSLRKRISRDLHDELSNSLAGLRYYVNDLRLRQPDQQTREVLKDVEEEVDTVYRQARSYMHNLSTGIEEAVGRLSPFLQRMSEELAGKLGLDIRLKYNRTEIESRLSTIQQNQLTLIIKEATTNIMNHSGATIVEIAIKFSSKSCYFSISDNGVGFEQHLPSDGIGMGSMLVRVKRLRGRIKTQTSPSGTIIDGNFPISSLSF